MPCVGCNTKVSKKVKDYSEEKYGKILCMKCQAIADNHPGDAIRKQEEVIPDVHEEIFNDSDNIKTEENEICELNEIPIYNDKPLISKLLYKLSRIQRDLKVPKNQRNEFAKFNYRSTSDILEGIKPLFDKYSVCIVVSDNIVMIGNRVYVKATAEIYDNDTGVFIESHAYAREQTEKKGMDEAQITGSASSYARKYALNGLLAIDDTRDPDSDKNE
uniref:Putative Erf family protein n=1 Tax=viral metagenome TaxID=1070528 RepID=A0A6M3LNL3_9ZZZZ